MAVATSLPGAATWPWTAAGLLALAAAIAVTVRPRGFSTAVAMALIALAAFSFGGLWAVVRYHWVPPDDLAALDSRAPRIVHLRGRALEPPRVREPSIGTLSGFGHNPPVTYFALGVTTLIGHDGTTADASGSVLVRVDAVVEPFAAGDLVEAVGLFYPPSPPRNPGEFDAVRLARSTGRAGLLVVTRRELLAVTPARRSDLGSAVLRGRSALRRRASGWLLADLPATTPGAPGQRDALLVALLLGQRSEQLDDLGEAFRGAGLSHFLAISGMHLGVLAGFIFFLCRLGGRIHRWHAWLVIVVMLTYLLIVEVRLPVLRAGIMTVAACIGVAAGRRLLVSSLVSISAVGLLLWRPDQLFSPGFQLSFGVVFGLIHLAPRLRARWFGRPDAFAATSARMIGQWLRTATAASVTAWMVATPITLFHWGVLWPLAAPFSVVLLPLVTAVLALGYLKIAFALVLPSAAVLTAVPLALAAEVLIAIVLAMDAVGLSAVRLVCPPAAWSLAALAWVAAWAVLGGTVAGFWGGRRGRLSIRLAAVVLVAWFVWPMLPAALRLDRTVFRIDMLAVGDGTCIVVRSGSSTVLFDAGSSSDRAVGRRVIVPALRRLGVRSIDALVVSHPNLDHYAAALELADAFTIREVLVTPQLSREARRDPYGAVMFLLGGFAERSVRVVEVAAGEHRDFGACRWSWLHPVGTETYGKLNDGSMVIRIEVAGRSVLLTGDIQRAAIDALGQLPAADIVELPHHGSLDTRAEAFVAGLTPSVVLQSTGRVRLRRTDARWSEVLGGSVRLVTARDGACSVVIDRFGAITFDRWMAPSPTIPDHEKAPARRRRRDRNPRVHRGRTRPGRRDDVAVGATAARVRATRVSPAGAGHARGRQPPVRRGAERAYPRLREQP